MLTTRSVISDGGSSDGSCCAAVKKTTPASDEAGLVVRVVGGGGGGSGLTDAELRAAPVAISGALTDSQLRATPVPVSGVVTASGPLTDAQLRAVAVPVSGPLTDSQLRATAVPVSGPATDAQLRATPLPVSGTITANGPLTDTQLRATAVPVSGPATDTQLRATPLPVSGTVTANIGTSGSLALDAHLTDGTMRGKITDGTNNAAVQNTPAIGTEQGLVVRNLDKPSTLCVTATGAAAAAVTLTLPAAGAGLFHYITFIRVQVYNTAARTGGATPVLVTTTNLPGSPVWTRASAGAVGTVEIQEDVLAGNPLKSSAANTATTIVCPATTSVIWRVTVHYYTGN